VPKPPQDVVLPTQGQVSIGTVNNINNGTITNNTFVINGLGEEDITYLTNSRDYKRFMSHCIRDNIGGVCEFMVRKHLDQDHPENVNIRKLNKKDEFIEYHDGKTWKLGVSDNVLDDVFSKIEKDFANFVDMFVSQDHLLQKQWIDRFMKKVGEPLEWDLTSTSYDYEFSDMSDDLKETMKARIYRIACQYIYRHSSKIH
jgi:hypothetical protein